MAAPDLIRTLGLEIGPRPAGSDAARQAGDVVTGAFADMGLDPWSQPFSLVGYTPEVPELVVGGETWAAGPAMYSQPTSRDGVTGRVRFLGLHRALPSLFEPLAFGIEDEAGAELARLYSNPYGPAGPFVTGYGPTLTGPSAYIGRDDAERLRALEGVAVKLRTGGRFVPGLQERNVVAELPGDGEGIVVIGAHLDSAWRAPGIVDDATGLAGMLELAERLVEVGRRRRTIRFIAFGSEELGLAGSRFHVAEAKLRGGLDRIVGMVNLDCLTGGHRFTIPVGPAYLEQRVATHVARLRLRERYSVDLVTPGPGADHFPFTMEGISALTISVFPYEAYHQADEGLDILDEQTYGDAVALAAAIVDELLDR